MANRLLVGIAGGSGSGKTTFCHQLRAAVGSEFVATLHHDSYYRDLSHLSFDERRMTNFDDPEALQTELLVDHATNLVDGHPVEVPRYDFNTHLRLDGGEPIESRPIIMIEGVLIFTHARLREICDLRIFVDAPDDVRFQRRMARDQSQRGRTRESIRRQWERTVQPMYERFVEPTKRWAHVVVPAEEPNETAIDVIRQYLRSEMNFGD